MEDIAYHSFLKQFKFKKHLEGYVGIEREHFLSSQNGIYIPQAKKFLAKINDVRWTYELSACQVESRTRPEIKVHFIRKELLENEMNGKLVAASLGLYLVNNEVADDTLPDDIYPDPRYLKVAKNMPKEMIRAGCRVAGTHIHIGVRNMTQAIKTYNLLVPHLKRLSQTGDHSNGQRLEMYRTMAVHWEPRIYENAHHFFEVAVAQGFGENLRNCWHLIRISRHGTVELRMFGAAQDIEEIIEWVKYAQSILRRH